jgi:hypothetical protein
MSVSKNTIKWLADVGIIVGISSLAIFFFPVFDALISSTCLHFVPRSQRPVFLFCDMLPLFLFGSVLGAVTACVLRHRKLVMAVLPPIIVCCFYLSYGYFGTIKYRPILPRSWYDVVYVVTWLIFLIAAFWAARFVLRKRKTAAPESVF